MMERAAAIKGLTSRSAWIRSRTADLLANCNDPDIHELLVGIMLDDEWAYVRAAAANALSTVADERLLLDFQRALQDPSEWVRVSVVGCLGRIDTADSLLTLRLQCGDDSGWVRLEALRAIGSIAQRLPALDFTEALLSVQQVRPASDEDFEFVKRQAESALIRAIAGVYPIPSWPGDQVSELLPIASSRDQDE